MSSIVIRVFSSNYEPRNFEQLENEVARLAKAKGCPIETIVDQGLKFQQIYPSTANRAELMRKSLRINDINHALIIS